VDADPSKRAPRHAWAAPEYPAKRKSLGVNVNGLAPQTVEEAFPTSVPHSLIRPADADVYALACRERMVATAGSAPTLARV
jgi:hypothetical protein